LPNHLPQSLLKLSRENTRIIEDTLNQTMGQEPTLSLSPEIKL
jgi:hypothetical protein